MGRIKNVQRYLDKPIPTNEDFIIGTDKITGKTITIKLGNLFIQTGPLGDYIPKGGYPNTAQELSDSIPTTTSQVINDGDGVSGFITVEESVAAFVSFLGAQTIGAGEKTFTDTVNFEGIVVNGEAYGIEATQANGFVVKSQLDLKSNISFPILEDIVSLKENVVGATSNRLRQVIAESDYWSIYGEAAEADAGVLVFEVGDNGSEFGSDGQRYEFRYKDAVNPALDKTVFTVDYDKVTALAELTADKLVSVSSVQAGDDSEVASLENRGSIRYRDSANISYADMSMKVGPTTYAWVNILQNTW
jgi:hypothetical protein